MKKWYNICGLTVCADFQHKTMTERSEKYRCDEKTADIIIPPVPLSELERLMASPGINEDSAENIYTADLFYTALLRFGGFMLHSSAVEVDGRAYLFSAPSGTGKSTHTSQWIKLFGDKARIINDDKPAIRFVNGEAHAYGTPWSGKSDLNINTGVPIQGICVLERSPENFIVPLDEGTAVYSILNQTLRPKTADYMDNLLTLLDRVIVTVPVWRMGCNISVEAAETAYKAMSHK
ncbi:MAG: hypothetical protein IJY73_09310 [Oscillospiraceae bacterium]|nr:hypothetical protein [Oscillospiraceae bacterium]